MDWLSENWFWILIVIFFIWMHRGGHCGGHGGHGGHGHHEDENDDARERHPTVSAGGAETSRNLEG